MTGIDSNVLIRLLVERHCDVRVQRGQRRVVQMLCVRVQAIKLVRPTAHDNHLAEPRFKRRD